MPRPETIAKARQIPNLIADGYLLREALKIVTLSQSGFQDVVTSDRETRLAYDRAREFRADLDIDDAVRIADDPSIDPQRARNMVDIRKWKASKHHPKVYGERIDVNLAQAISITDARSLALARVLPVCDQALTLDATIIDLSTLNDIGASDSVSDAPDSGPDIFD